MSSPSGAGTVTESSFDRTAALCAAGAGIAGLGYAVAFVVSLRTGSSPAALLAAIFLLLGGALALPVFTALYLHVRGVSEGPAMVALLFGAAGAIGAAIHGGYDLAIVINPPGGGPRELPNAVDPRGLLTFGFTAVALVVIATLIRKARVLPTSITVLAYINAVLLAVLYLGRLIILDPNNPVIQAAAVISGVITNPVLYALIAVALWRRAAMQATT